MKNKLASIFDYIEVAFRADYPITLKAVYQKDLSLKKQLKITHCDYIKFFNVFNDRSENETIKKLDRIDEKFLNPGVKSLSFDF